MNVESTLPGLLSLALIAGGSMMVIEAARRQKQVVAERVALVAPSSTVAGPETTGEALLRLSAKGLQDSELNELTRICRRFNIPPRYTSLAFATARLLVGALMGTLALLAVQRLGNGGGGLIKSLGVLLLAPIAVIAGWLIPLVLIRRRVAHRAQVVSAGLPEALELLVVCVEAGLSLEDGLDRITHELARSQPQLAEELAATAADLKILPDRDQAFAYLAERVGSPAISSVVTTLSQTLKYGTPLANALRVAAAELRNDALLAMEERANRMPSLMTIPMMLFIMPTIFLIVGGPALLHVLDALGRR